jgi:hypothetical protein
MMTRLREMPGSRLMTTWMKLDSCTKLAHWSSLPGDRLPNSSYPRLLRPHWRS